METPTMKPDMVLILDYGSQYTHLISRRIRSLNVFTLVILSGGPHSVHALNAPSFPDGFIEWAESNGVHVLGICYGMQLIVQKLGGVVLEGEKKEYGKMEIEVKGKSEIFGSESGGEKQIVLMIMVMKQLSFLKGLKLWLRVPKELLLLWRIGRRGFMDCSIILRY